MIEVRSRFVGSMLGTFCGDALGMPVENWSGDRIRRTFGMLDEMRPAALWYDSVSSSGFGRLAAPVADAAVAEAVISRITHNARYIVLLTVN